MYGDKTIVTKNAITNSIYSLIRDKTKYLLWTDVKQIINTYNNEKTKDKVKRDILKRLYRRFIRVNVFVSNTKMVKDTYKDYVRYKFIKEDYHLKESIISSLDNPKSIASDSIPSEIETIVKSFEFVIKAISYIPEDSSKGCTYDIARDNTICRQILKNILTIEHEKMKQLIPQSIPWNDEKIRVSTPYLDYRIQFNHLKKVMKYRNNNDKGITTNDDTKKKSEKKKSAITNKLDLQLQAIGEFDKCLIYLNKSLGTRL
ncbi:Irc19p NDAI_0D04880 [Naumovozyma dairenensis CBS 421]|uniref:Uncharacterized protein n=1 Tax=Naumovozyma dairenensis (strain ATCC 10597 / BCRC 20456 / CBS 421 / NBRC 0211 / NRRL Y-12639) TaxID=1071378 RepID=G0WAJ0_NAUDC|nr:hypothetical protein NDAI_0D04880 [Naumovozyma dairenensis CBS 421]CCD24801.1 hypothetical protein NDAI_0D04880 [Naumovozyma dairenensis CBS 421]